MRFQEMKLGKERNVKKKKRKNKGKSDQKKKRREREEREREWTKQEETSVREKKEF